MKVRRPTSLKKQAYDAIRNAVLQQELRRDLIYSEQWFADQLQISRTPVREAILQLNSEELVDVLPNRGIVIKSPSLADARNVYQMRAAIEGYCSAHLARNARKEDALRALERIHTVLERCHENFNYEDELQFHMEIIQYTDNPEFISQFKRMRNKIDILWNEVANQANRHGEVYEEHKAIYELMCAGDAAGAREASERHMRITFEKVQRGNLLKPCGELKPVVSVQ